MYNTICPKCNGSGTTFRHYAAPPTVCELCKGKGFLTNPTPTRKFW